MFIERLSVPVFGAILGGGISLYLSGHIIVAIVVAGITFVAASPLSLSGEISRREEEENDR